MFAFSSFLHKIINPYNFNINFQREFAVSYDVRTELFCHLAGKNHSFTRKNYNICDYIFNFVDKSNNF